MENKNKNYTRNHILYSTVKNENGVEEVPNKVATFGQRHLQCLWLFLLLFIGYGFRVVLSVTIVAMTNPEASSNPAVPTYPEWKNKGAILSAFFWGYILPQVFAGYAANRFSAKHFVIATMAIQCTLGLLIPYTAAHFGQTGVIINRACQGFCQGFFFPTIAHLLSQWVPHEERARLTSFTYGAVPFGTVIAMLVAGLISASWYGWPMVFYGYGALGLLWCILFSFFGSNSPADHSSITDTEKYYIEKSLGHTDEKPRHNVPWKAIFTSVPVWALITTQCGFVFGFWILLTQIPSYMHHVMNFNIKNNSMLSSLPYLTLFFLGLILSFISDYIINKGLIRQSVSRKLFNSLGNILPSVFLILLGYTRSDEPIKAVCYLILAVGMAAATTCGWGVNHMDLTPNYTGTLMGVCNGISNIFALMAPLIVQLLVTNESDPVQWRTVFFLAAGVNFVTGMVFNIFGSAEVQPWNDNPENEKKTEMKTF